MQRFRKVTGRKFNFRVWPDNRNWQAGDYDFWFYLGDGGGCTKLALTGRAYDVTKAKAAARERLGQARAWRLEHCTPPKA